jgi:hypothetical protein
MFNLINSNYHTTFYYTFENYQLKTTTNKFKLIKNHHESKFNPRKRKTFTLCFAGPLIIGYYNFDLTTITTFYF